MPSFLLLNIYIPLFVMYSIIAAIDAAGGLGYNGGLLCHLRSDLQRFKVLTSGHCIIMGRKTFFSLPTRPLPNRLNIVLSHTEIAYPDVLRAASIEEVQAILQERHLSEAENFIIGGSSVYRAFLPLCHRLYITHIEHRFAADVFFPTIGDEWQKVALERVRDTYDYTFAVYERD